MGLRSFVYVQDEHGNSVGFGPGDAVPAWAAEQITNPDAWADEPKAAGNAEPGVETSDDDAPTDDPTPRPPVNGPGSGRAAWAAYAEALGFDIEDGATKADIIAAVTAE